MQDIEETDWKRVEEHLNAGHRVEVELSSASLKGFVVWMQQRLATFLLLLLNYTMFCYLQ